MKNFRIWLRLAAIIQILTGLIHSMSFFSSPIPANSQEQQLYDLVQNYQLNLGAGYLRSFSELFLSVSATFTILYFFGGMVTLMLLRYKVSHFLIKNYLLLNVILFGIVFLVMTIYAFLPPIILCGAVFVILLIAYLLFLSQLYTSKL